MRIRIIKHSPYYAEIETKKLFGKWKHAAIAITQHQIDREVDRLTNPDKYIEGNT